ncbi:hypothetical protein Acr_00g0074980 [Actinidia rufa]|uniref:Uncharacterized protein n=1 Tax=Actinidia rufa TaxID=165716 RepID=A0A7J0DT33_9ERIC|nr:hypothetical protein Acr_00g0074980 [Actinidia rufa]
MHLRNCYLPRPSASNPLDNKAHPMANTSQALGLKGLHRDIHSMAEQMRVMNENNTRLIQLLAMTNPPLLAAPPIPDIERSHRPHHSGDNHSQNHSTGQERKGRHRSPSPPRRERNSSSSESRSSSKTPRVEGKEVRRGRSPRRNDQTRRRNMSTSQKIQDLDARLDAINTGAGVPVTVDTLIRQTEPPFTERILRTREIESLKDYVKQVNQAILEVEDFSDKVVIMAMMEGLQPDPLFDSLSKNVPETLSALQNKADKYIAVEELAEAKRRRRGKDDHKRKELNTRRFEYRDEARSKRTDQDSKWTNERRPRTPPRCPERYGDNRPTARDTQVIHYGFGSGGCTSSSRKRHVRNAHNRAEEEIYNLFSPFVDTHPPNTFNNDDLRGLHLPYDDAFVVSAVIANFNVQRILVDNGSSANILFVPAFDKMKIGLDKLHPFHTPLVGFGGNMTHPLGWIKLPVTLGMEPHQTTIWQAFIVVDCPSPYNAILGRPTLGGTKAITSTYHLKMKFSTSTGITDDEMEVLRDEVEQITLADPRETENNKPLEEVAPISIYPKYPDLHVMIGIELIDEDVPTRHPIRSTSTRLI